MHEQDQDVKNLAMLEREFEKKYEMSFECFERVLKTILDSEYWSESDLKPLIEDYKRWRSIRMKLR
jgi:hypothetical protein